MRNLKRPRHHKQTPKRNLVVHYWRVGGQQYPQNTIVNNTVITTTEPEKTLSITKEEISIPIPTLIPTVSYEIVDEENPSKTITQTSSLSPLTSATTNQIVVTKTPTNDPFDLRNNPFFQTCFLGLLFTLVTCTIFHENSLID